MTLKSIGSADALPSFIPSDSSDSDSDQDLKVSRVSREKMKPLVTKSSHPYPDIHRICDNIREKFKDTLENDEHKNILLVIKLILSNEPTRRFFHKDKLRFNKETMEEFEGLKEYIDTKSASRISSKNAPDPLKKLISVVCNEMAALYLRPQTLITKVDIEGRKVEYLQRCGHVNVQGALVEGLTLSSDALKFRYSSSSGYNLNLASVQLTKANKEVFHLMARSARTDNISRLLKLVQFSFIRSTSSVNKPGISYNSDGTPEFQMALYTAQDPHPTRNLIKKFEKKVHMDERTSIKNIKLHVDTLWPRGKSIPIQVSINGKDVVFWCKRPILKNFSLSQTSQDPQIIKDTRKWSLEGSLRELELLRNVEAVQKSERFGKAIGLLNNQNTLTKEKAVEFFQYIKENVDLTDFDNPIDRKIYLALKGLKISFTHKDFKGKEFLKAADPGIELFYHYYLVDLINTSIAVQCKAGCDRALIMTALLLAQKQLETESLTLFDIDDPASEEEYDAFVDEFKTFCRDFGGPIFEVSRGNRNMKALDKPLLQRLLGNPLKEDSIPGLKLVSGT